MIEHNSEQILITEDVPHESLDSSQVASVIIVSQSNKMTTHDDGLNNKGHNRNDSNLIQLGSLKDQLKLNLP